MRVHRFILVTLVTALVCIPASAFACGESLFRVGKGVTYREYNAPIPGNIVMVARTQGELAMAERLEAAGHRVTVVSNTAELQSALNDQSIDVVMSWYSERDEVQPAAGQFAATYLPVTADGEAREARGEYRYSVSGDGDVKDFLKAIHKTLKQRRA